jgi:tetratricopeptide (TPR) repeat protein
MRQSVSRLIHAIRRHPVASVLVLAAVAGLGWGGTVAGRRYWAQQQFRAAQQAYHRGELNVAQHHLDLCLKVLDDRADVQLLAAQTARRLDDYDEADRHLSACERLPGDKDATTLERELLIAQQGDPESVLDHLQAVAADRSNLAGSIWEAIAKGYLNCYGKQDALKFAERLLQRTPEHIGGHLCRGRALESLDRFDEAEREYARALQLAPSSDEARLRLAGVLYRLGRPWEAQAHYENLRQRQPDRADVLLGLARCYYDLHQLDDARRVFDQLLDHYPDDVRALLDRGRLEFHAKRNAEAERWLRRAAELAPRDRDVCLAFVHCLEAQDKQSEARVCRERLRQIEAELLQIDELMEKANHSGEDAALRYQIGVRLRDRGQEEDAVSWFFAALGDDHAYAPAHAALADYFERTGQHYRAAWQRQAARGAN